MNPRLYIDFIQYLPAEVCLKILGYLDPVSLLSVAQTCRAWYSLSLDRTLWQRLYHYEGWKVISHEIEAAEEMANRRTATGSMHRQKSEEDGHTHKKRAVSLEDDDDDDQIMTDAAEFLCDEPKALEAEKSLFGGPTRSTMTPAFRDLNVQGSTSSSISYPSKGKGVDKGKGKAVELSPSAASAADQAANLPKSRLWIWDPSAKKQRLNWQYLYSMRRKLEANWEQGNFKNFQLPHPDHPEEGHNRECIYSLQYNDEYLVSGSRDKTLRIWNLATRRLVRKPLIGHIGSVLCLQFDSDPSEDIIVSGSSDSDVIIWKFSTGEIIQRLTHAHRESVLNVKFDKRILATCSKDRTIKIFNRRNLKAGDPGYVNPVAINLRRYGHDASPLDQQQILPPFTMIGVLEGHSAAVNAVQIVDNEVVSASGDRQIKVWDWQTGVCKRTFVGHSKGIACVQYDGKRIVSGSSDNEVKIFDRETGIEVASLRDHTDLVRTVQAGFGDLPWSNEEDVLEARSVDEAYKKALEDGEILSSSARRGRHGNAGSSEPDEITAYGAKLPPGGGGGKRWGRIVSGSYDKSIIIWRRDKSGKWRPQHHLKQEEAAQRSRGPNARPPPPGPPGTSETQGGTNAGGGGGSGSSRRAQAASAPSRQSVAAAINVARAARGTGADRAAPSGGSPSSSRPAQEPLAATPSSSRPSGFRPRFSHVAPINPANLQLPPMPHVEPNDPHSGPSIIQPGHDAALTASYIQMIDVIVPQGVHAVQQALNNYPGLLALQSHLQAAIDREASPFVRSQLRQVVSAATVRAQVAQARARSQAVQNVVGSPDRAAPPSGTPDDAGPGSSRAGAAPGSGPGSGSSSGAVPAVNPAVPAPVAVANAAASNTGNIAGPPPPAAGAGGHQRAHPHAPEVGMPTRIYKVQFDARRIICCSQTDVIVGWDFCNGDPALEEVARFFATVD